MPTSLLKQTYALLRETELSREQIACGADVGIEWLKKFQAEQIDDPSVNRVQRLHDFLLAQQSRPTRSRTASASL